MPRWADQPPASTTAAEASRPTTTVRRRLLLDTVRSAAPYRDQHADGSHGEQAASERGHGRHGRSRERQLPGGPFDAAAPAAALPTAVMSAAAETAVVVVMAASASGVFKDGFGIDVVVVVRVVDVAVVFVASTQVGDDRLSPGGGPP